VDWIEQGVFSGNSDQDSKVNVILSKPTVARYVRIEVVSVHGHASARWDVLKTADQSSLQLDMPNLLRANPSINQYSFSSCHGGDAPGQGHCRPQIDSPQVRFCFACGPCVERQCMWRLLPSRAGRRSLSKVAGCPLTSRLRRALPVCFYRAVTAAAAAIRFDAQ
jgi:hypothetical protein